jgi:hypothetical protein
MTIIREATRWDYIQDGLPTPNPRFPFAQWLRTTDFIGFLYDEANNRWISMGDPFFVSGSGRVGSAVTGDTNRYHKLIETANVAHQFPYQDLLLRTMTIACKNTPNTSDAHNNVIRVRGDASTHATVLHSLRWTNSQKFTTERDIDVEIVKEAKLNFEYAGSTGSRPDTWWAQIGCSLRVDGS